MMRQSNTLLALSDRIYRLLLIAYPDDFRRTYGAEMAQVFHDSCRDAIVRASAVGIAEVWLRTIGDLIVSALKERAAAPDKRRALKYAEERSANMRLFRQAPRERMSFDTFTKRASNALRLATEEARALNHAYIGTEHLLLGLIRERPGVSGVVLHNLGITLDHARGATQSLVGVGKQPAPELQPLTKRAMQAIERAVEEARQLNHSFVGTEHLLLGIIETSDGAAVGVLDYLGMPADRVRAEVLRVLGQAEHR
jgi:hypothetical protein